MGASWVQVDTKEEYVINKSAIRARGWPSSTKAELLAIWCVILIVPSKSKIKIYTDSAAAIASISNNDQYMTNRKKIRKKNYNLIIDIENTIKIKKIELELVKVKSYSNNR
jgi:ribonuclease HI